MPIAVTVRPEEAWEPQPAEAPPLPRSGWWALTFGILGLIVSFLVGWGFLIGLIGAGLAIAALRRPWESRAVAVWALCLSVVSLVGFLYFVTQHLQLIIGMSPLEAGLALVPGLALMIVAGLAAGEGLARLLEPRLARRVRLALIGLAAGYDIDMTPYLSEAGTTTLKGIENTCVLEVTKYAGTKSSTLTADGRPLTAYFDEEPFKSVLADNKIGNRKPAPPVLVTHSLADDVIPYSVGRAMAKSWCEKGANVRFRPILAPTHIGGALPTSTDALLFFKARFAGVNQLSNCWALS